MSIFGIGLGLGGPPSIIRGGHITGRFSAAARDYFALVEAGGGTVVDKAWTDSFILELQRLEIYDNARCLIGARMGNTIRTSGSDVFSSKAWDASPLRGHYTQPAEASQPKIVGNQYDFDSDRNMLGDSTARTALRNAPGICAMAMMRGPLAGDCFYNYWHNDRFNGTIRFAGRSNGNVRVSMTKASDSASLPPIDTNTATNQDAVISVNTIGNVAHAYVNLSSSLGTAVDLGPGNFPDREADEAVIGARRVEGGLELSYDRLGRMILLFNRELTGEERVGMVTFLMETHGV
jgi:hypothetical protein